MSLHFYSKSAYKTINSSYNSDHMMSLLSSLHWLPVTQLELFVLTFKAIHGLLSPSFPIMFLLWPFGPSAPPPSTIWRSSVPFFDCPYVWNCRSHISLSRSCFQSHLKTHQKPLAPWSWPESCFELNRYHIFSLWPVPPPCRLACVGSPCRIIRFLESGPVLCYALLKCQEHWCHNTNCCCWWHNNNKYTAKWLAKIC